MKNVTLEKFFEWTLLQSKEFFCPVSVHHKPEDLWELGDYILN